MDVNEGDAGGPTDADGSIAGHGLPLGALPDAAIPDVAPHGVAPTLEVVAARAGVSRATVSRVVNGSTKVTPEVVKAVNDAIAALDYVPNRAARSLASRRTQSIALVVPESTSRVFADPFFAAVTQGVALELAATDYTLNLLMASEASPEKTRRYLLGGNVDGALVVSHHRGDHSYTQLGQHLPIVFAGRPIGRDVESIYVDVDNVAGGRMATAHLLDSGRSRIATIAGRQDMPAGIDRLLGWRQAMEAAGLGGSDGGTRDPHASGVDGADDPRTDRGADSSDDPLDQLVEYGDFSPLEGAAAMRRLLDRGVPIDGVFAANDQMAAGAISVLREAGLRVPEDVGVIGFDDDSFGATASPPLTTIDQSPVELGATMAALLVRLIAGETVPRITILPTRLVPRASV